MFNLSISQQGFICSPHYTTLFILRSSAGITLILLYVDNMIITRDDSTGIYAFQHFLSEHFKIKDLGTLRNFLGFEVTSSSSGYYLSQAKYALTFSPMSVSQMTRPSPLPWNSTPSSLPWMVNLYWMLLVIVS